VLPRLSRLLADPAAFLYVAEADGELIGFISGYAMPLIQREPAGRLAALVVGDGARGAGVGRALVEAVTDEARRRGCDRLEVTSAAYREDAHSFYEHLGFEDRPRRFVKQL
jgi:GNAT superfamily N-acetyltransferase